jgi:hypothetical protein
VRIALVCNVRGLTFASNDTTDDDLESEEGGGVPPNPYPLEGQYVDEEDRERCVNVVTEAPGADG